MADSIIPTVSLVSSATVVTMEGDVTLTATATDGHLTGVEIWRNGVLYKTLPYNSPVSTAKFVFTAPFVFQHNGINTFTAIAYDYDGNRGRSNSIDVQCNIQPHDTFIGLAAGNSLSNTSWDTRDRVWDTKTYLSSDGNGAVKIDPAQYGIAANYLSKTGDVGQAVLFKTTGARSASGNLFSIAIDCAGSVASNSPLACVEALLNGADYLYIKGDGKITAKKYNIEALLEYWFEICKVDDKTYNVRLSKNDSGKRGAIVASGQLVLTTARASTDMIVQLRTSAANKDILRIIRVESLTDTFDVAATETSVSTGTTTTAPKVAPTYLFSETSAAISGPSGLVIKFGAKGAPQPLAAVEKMYSGMRVGFNGATQDRWRMRPVTVGGIQYIIMAALDSDGRVDVWVNAMWAAATSQTAINREHAQVDIQISYLGTALNLYGTGTTFSPDMQRATWFRYETKPLTWNTSHDYLVSKTTDGTFLPHDTRNVIGSDENAVYVDEKPAYIPYVKFSDTIASNGLPQFDQRYKIGTQYRGSSAGGERIDIGPVHEWFARLISEVGTNNNTTWLTTAKLDSLRYLAESVAQFPQSSGMINPSDGRLIDPSEGPFSCHRNATAWGPCIGIPQPGMSGYSKNDEAEMKFDTMWDVAHRMNVGVSYHAWFLSNDPWHLFQTQASAVACIAYTTGGHRGSDGKTLRVGVEEERGFWWGFQSLLNAWKATPEGDLPAPFRTKAFFEKAIDNTLQWIRDNYMQKSVAFPGVAYDAARFWRIMAPFPIENIFPGEIFTSPYMRDYGHIVTLTMLRMGYTKGRDVAEWGIENLRLRAQAGGSWYAADKVLNTKGGLGQSIVFKSSEASLSYSDLATYKATHPRKDTAYIAGNLTAGQWAYGRDMYLFVACLWLLARAKQDGLLTVNFDPKAEALAMIERHPGPYTTNGLKTGYWIFGKQNFKPIS